MIKRRIERALERPLEDVFAEFEETPIASASLAQVHKARLDDGRVVAVKVQYPGIQKIVENDLRNVSFLLRILAQFERNLDFGPIIEEMHAQRPAGARLHQRRPQRRADREELRRPRRHHRAGDLLGVHDRAACS